jgi:hypothetical protein
MATLKTMITDWLRIKTQSGTPATPVSGYSIIYEEGGALKLKTSAGVVTVFGASTVDDGAYPTGWDTDTTHAPSRNAVYDKINSLSLLNDYIKVSDVKTANISGGSFASGAWRTRDINTEDSDSGGHCTVGSNQITLAAGTYICKITAPAYHCGSHKVRLQNISDATTTLLGASCYSSPTSAQDRSGNDGYVSGKFTIAGSKIFEVQHYCSSTESIGFGVPSNFGVNEVYTIAEFWKVG